MFHKQEEALESRDTIQLDPKLFKPVYKLQLQSRLKLNDGSEHDLGGNT